MCIRDRAGLRSPSRLIFSVVAAGKTLWKSAPVSISTGGTVADVALGGARTFLLTVRDANNNSRLAHADWADIRITLKDGSELRAGAPLDEKSTPSCLPFSFIYGGTPSQNLLPEWKRKASSKTDAAGNTAHRITHTDPKTGLSALVEVTEFHDAPAIEWVLYFRNGGGKDTPIIEDVRALHTVWPADGDMMLHRSRGSQCRIDDFLYTLTPLTAQDAVHMVAGGGRSSDNWLPFFNLQTENCGLITAVGWTGQWAAQYERTGEGVTLRAGMELTRLKLKPAETIRTPRILLLFWNGDPARAGNLLRRFMVKYHTPVVGGKPLVPPLTAVVWGGMKTPCMLERINLYRSKRLKYDYFWADAGWYGPEESYSPNEFQGDWYMHVGNWSVNPKAHPKGLKPVSDAARRAGMKFLLWFEPERAVAGTPLTQKHPDWFLGDNTPGKSLAFNLGIPQARRWLVNFLARFMLKNGVKCYRQDFNFAPLPYWRSADAPDRQGITEIRHVEGLYAFWDELRRRIPDILIDNCASGGRRIDLETVSRSIPLWRSDYQCFPTFDPMGAQIQFMGLSRWLPFHGTSAGMRPNDLYNFRSALSPALAMGLFAYENDSVDPAYPYESHRKMLDEYYRVRPFFSGDFHPLTPSTASDEDWSAYQLHRDDLDAGVLVAIRRPHSPFVSAAFALKGLDEKAVYECEDADTGRKVRMTGKTLASNGVSVRMPRPRDARLVYYRKAKQPR